MGAEGYRECRAYWCRVQGSSGAGLVSAKGSKSAEGALFFSARKSKNARESEVSAIF